MEELAISVNSKLLLDLEDFKKKYYLDDPSIPADWKQAIIPSEQRRIIIVVILVYSTGAIISAMSADRKNSELIEHIISAFEVDIVLVLDYEKLHNELRDKYGSKMQIVKLEKSGGVSDGNSTQEMKQVMINAGIRSYFAATTVKSYQISLLMSKYKIFKIFSKETTNT